MTAFDPDKIFALEWSRSQNCFHIHTLDDCACANLQSLHSARTNGYIPDYMPIAFGLDHQFFKDEEQEERLYNLLSVEYRTAKDSPSTTVTLGEFKFRCTHLLAVGGCYGVFDSKAALYIGRSKNLFSRVCSHFTRRDGRMAWACAGSTFGRAPIADLRCEIRIWVSEIHERLERELIREFKPKYNIVHNP